MVMICHADARKRGLLIEAWKITKGKDPLHW